VLVDAGSPQLRGRQLRFLSGQHPEFGCIWYEPIHHREPEDALTQDAHQCDQVRQMLRSAQARLLDATSRLQNLVIGLDFPAQCIPLECFDGLLSGSDRQIRDQFPVDLRIPVIVTELGVALFKL
jgi:hypothetical protein